MKQELGLKPLLAGQPEHLKLKAEYICTVIQIEKPKR